MGMKPVCMEPVAAPHPRAELAERQFSLPPLPVKTRRGRTPAAFRYGICCTSPLPVPLRGEGVGGIGDEPIRAEGEGRLLAPACFEPQPTALVRP
jgi:hypothetical protein